MSDTLLMVADSERDANMLYGTGFVAGDPFIYFNFGRRPHIVLNDLEIDRARRQAPHCRAVSSSVYHQKLRRNGVKFPGFAHIIREILRENKIRRAVVPDNFPLGLARDLKRLGIKLKPRANYFPKREFKSADEIRKISAALVMAEVGMAEGMQALRLSKIDKRRQLIYRGSPLTSERLRAVIDCAILQACGLAANTIVAGGRQGCDPHERGYGPLRAHEPIILDIFPRSQKTGYFGDITRTVVRGRASEAVKKLYDTVFHGQKIALQKVSAGTLTQRNPPMRPAIFYAAWLPYRQTQRTHGGFFSRHRPRAGAGNSRGAANGRDVARQTEGRSGRDRGAGSLLPGNRWRASGGRRLGHPQRRAQPDAV